MEPVSPLPPFRCRIKLDGYHDYAVTLLVGFTLSPLFRFEISLYCEQFTLLDSVNESAASFLRQASTGRKADV